MKQNHIFLFAISHILCSNLLYSSFNGPARQIMEDNTQQQLSDKTTMKERCDSCCYELHIKPFENAPCATKWCLRGTMLICGAICLPCTLVGATCQISYACCGCKCAKKCLEKANRNRIHLK